MIIESQKAVCKIFIKDTNEIATGFFADIYPSFKCLLTNYKIIPPNIIESNTIIEILNDSGVKEELKLNKNERYIKCFENYDITIIQIKKSDKINNYFSSLQFDLNYRNIPDRIEQDIQYIFSLYYPISENISLLTGEIKKISNYEFIHTISTCYESLGCPIISTSNNTVIGINKQGKNVTENYGTFLGVIFEEIDEDIKQGLLDIKPDINLYNNNFFPKKINNQYIITAEIDIDEKNINKDILIINSYEEFLRKTGNKRYDLYLRNEKQIKKCKIKINDVDKEFFSYTYNFKEAGKYTINYKFDDNINNLTCLFNGCSLLKSIDFSNFNSDNVKYMGMMFYECSSLTNINFFNFSTENVTEMKFMFALCNSLVNLDVSNFNTGNVTEMQGMFSFCTSIRNLDLSNFNTENVTDLERMFSGCNLLAELNLSNFNTKNAIDMGFMFSNCSKLKKINLSSFDTRNATNMEGMFLFCTSLEDLDLSNFYTPNVSNMSQMFYFCTSLKNLDLTNFDIKNVEYMDEMFLGCISLKKDKLNKLKNYVFIYSEVPNNFGKNQGNEKINEQKNKEEINQINEESNKIDFIRDMNINNERQLFINLVVNNLKNTEHHQRNFIEFTFIPNFIADLFSIGIIDDNIMLNPSTWKYYFENSEIINARFLEKISVKMINLKNGEIKFILIFPPPKYGNECFYAILYFDEFLRPDYYTLELELGNDFDCPEGYGLVCGQKGNDHLNFYSICKVDLEEFQNIVEKLYKKI